jgi:hypothetical protein
MHCAVAAGLHERLLVAVLVSDFADEFLLSEVTQWRGPRG